MVEKIKLQEIKFGFSDEDVQIRADLHQYQPEPTFSVYDALEGGDASKFKGRTCKAGY